MSNDLEEIRKLRNEIIVHEGRINALAYNINEVESWQRIHLLDKHFDGGDAVMAQSKKAKQVAKGKAIAKNKAIKKNIAKKIAKREAIKKKRG